MKGTFIAVGSGICFGTLALLTKLFYDSGGRPFDLLVIRLVGAALLAWFVIFATKRPRPPRRAAKSLLPLGVFQIAHNVALLVAYEHAPVSLVVLLLYTFPLVVTIVDSLVFGAPFGGRQLAALGLGLVGTGLTLGAPDSVPLIGVLLGITASLALAAYIFTAKSTMQRASLEPLQLIAVGYTGAAVTFVGAALVGGFHSPSAVGWLCAIGIVAIGTVLASFLFYTAIPLAGAPTTSTLTLIDPAMSLLLAFALLGEALRPGQIVGAAMILGSVVTIALPGLRRAPKGVPLPAAR